MDPYRAICEVGNRVSPAISGLVFVLLMSMSLTGTIMVLQACVSSHMKLTQQVHYYNFCVSQSIKHQVNSGTFAQHMLLAWKNK